MAFLSIDPSSSVSLLLDVPGSLLNAGGTVSVAGQGAVPGTRLCSTRSPQRSELAAGAVCPVAIDGRQNARQKGAKVALYLGGFVPSRKRNVVNCSTGKAANGPSSRDKIACDAREKTWRFERQPVELS